MKVRDDALLRAQVAKEEADKIGSATIAIRERIDRGGKLIIFGNGGSAPDANNPAIASVLPPAGHQPTPPVSLSLQPAHLSPIAHDVCPQLLFQRPPIAP